MGKSTDHKGNVFDSQAKMLRFYGITKNAFKGRQKRGWDLERTLTEPLRQNSLKVTDHLGNEFTNIKEMCKHYGIDDVTYTTRLQRGMTQEEALTTPKNEYLNQYKVLDPYGNEFASIKQMCKFYKTNRNTFEHRKKLGFPYKECLISFNDFFGYKIVTKRTDNGYYGMINIKTGKMIMNTIDKIIEIYKKNHHLEDLPILEVYKHYYLL